MSPLAKIFQNCKVNTPSHVPASSRTLALQRAFFGQMSRLFQNSAPGLNRVPGYPGGFPSPCQMPQNVSSLTVINKLTFDPSISTMSPSSPIYELEESNKMSSQLVNEWVETLECPIGNGPNGLLARVHAAWTVVAKSSVQSPCAIQYLGLETVCLFWPHVFCPYLPTYRAVCPCRVTFGRGMGLRSKPG
jgi:hypothetical protein